MDPVGAGSEIIFGTLRQALAWKPLMFESPLPKVLVVDDEAPVCEFLKVAIAPKASSVAVAENAATALEAIERGNFDIILCDIYMPGCSGMELLSLARQSTAFFGSEKLRSIEKAVWTVGSGDEHIAPLGGGVLHHGTARAELKCFAALVGAGDDGDLVGEASC